MIAPLRDAERREDLAEDEPVAEHADLPRAVLIGPTGIGKSFLSCAFVERACRRSFTARYVRMPPLLHELAVGRGDGSYGS